jgi:phosphonopyruvate decarboxylase
LLQHFCECLADHASAHEHLIAANEGGAVAAAIGYHLATGRTPLVYMQNSGLPNALNPLLSLADPAVYAIPMLLLIGWRGEPGTLDEPQHRKQGEVTLPLLAASQIGYAIIDPTTTDPDATIRQALQQAAGGPYALVVRKGTFSAYRTPVSTPAAGSFRREQAVALIVDSLEAGDLVVATTGMTARELYAHRARSSQSHDRDFLVIGGMGHASQIAHTLAVYRSDQHVYCLDGDGAVLMHMGALAIIGATHRSNLRHIVLNNGVHESVGGQPTVGFAVDLLALARSVGYATATRVTTLDELPRALDELRRGEGPALLEVQVAPGHRADLGRPQSDPVDAKKAWLSALLG